MAISVGNIIVTLDKRRLQMIQSGLDTKAEKVLEVAARHIKIGWKGYIIAKHVIDTGAYLNSIHIETPHAPFERIISDQVEYGVYQEFGTVYYLPGEGRPTLGPAVEDERPNFLKAWDELFR